MKKYYQFKLYPTKIQAKRLFQEMFVAKQIYDILLSFFNNPDKRDFIFEYQVEKEIQQILSKRNLSINSKVLQQEVRSFRTLIVSRSKLKQQGIQLGELKFKKFKETNNYSFKTCGTGQYSVERISEKKGILKLFRMEIPFAFSRDLPSIPKTLIISFDGIDFFASFCVEVPTLAEIQGLNIRQTFNTETSLGMDLNNHSIDFGTLSQHYKYKIQPLKNINKTIRKLEKLSRKMAKSREKAKLIAKNIGEEKPKESENYKKLTRKFKKLHRKVKRQRDARILDIKSYFIKVMLENNLNQVAVEDLSVVELTSKENVVVKIGTKKSMAMRKNILSIGYGKIRLAIKNACVQFGWRYNEVETKYSSKQCSCCGNINYELELKDREYVCKNSSCGFVIARDFNACRNLIQRIIR